MQSKTLKRSDISGVIGLNVFEDWTTEADYPENPIFNAMKQKSLAPVLTFYFQKENSKIVLGSTIQNVFTNKYAITSADSWDFDMLSF
jgi:hypothetical protein